MLAWKFWVFLVFVLLLHYDNDVKAKSCTLYYCTSNVVHQYLYLIECLETPIPQLYVPIVPTIVPTAVLIVKDFGKIVKFTKTLSRVSILLVGEFFHTHSTRRDRCRP